MLRFSCKEPMREIFYHGIALLWLAMGMPVSGNASLTGAEVPSSSTISTTDSPSISSTAAYFAIADFDGDNRPDLVTVHTGQGNSSSTRYWIGFQLSSGLGQTIGVSAPSGGLQIVSRDVNGDSFLDVVVTTAWTNRPVAVLLNDGHGMFTRLAPSAVSTAVWSVEREWNALAVAMKDSSVAVVVRSGSEACGAGSGMAARPRGYSFRYVDNSATASLCIVASHCGRAPPFPSAQV